MGYPNLIINRKRVKSMVIIIFLNANLILNPPTISSIHKAYTKLFAVSICFELTQEEFFDIFCQHRLNSFECSKFVMSLERERDKYEVKHTFDESIKMKEDQELSPPVYYNWSTLFCIKYFKREYKISIKNKFYYSLRICEDSEKAYAQFERQLMSLVFRIYIHPMESKPDLKKDYVYKYVFKQEQENDDVNIQFDRTESLLLPPPYWTECKHCRS